MRRRCRTGPEHGGVRSLTGMAHRRREGRALVGISGYDYASWREAFYPPEVPRKEWLAYASRLFDSIELNGTFYSLKSPQAYRAWAGAVPRGFPFAVKGSRFITHNLKLKNCDRALANFFASGILELGPHLGPFLWQLPATYRFEADRIEGFLAKLPRTTHQLARLARGHDERVRRGASVEPDANRRLRHALEARHPSYLDDTFFSLLRAHDCACVIADTAGKFPFHLEVTSELVYVRLHGSTELYASQYSLEELHLWAARIRAWTRRGLDVCVYFDNDAKVFAPHDALMLRLLIGEVRTSRSPLEAHP